MDHNVVRQWLRSVLGQYALSDRVYTHVDALLLAYSSLSPKTEVYTYDDGRTALLLRIAGTIPITFRGATYHIPVAIWLPHAYPREPPLVYVEPVKGMAIRKGHKHVQLDGRLAIPGREFEEERHKSYIRRWERKWEACNLVELVHFLQTVFGQEPPVYAVTNNNDAAAGAGSSGSPRPAARPQEANGGSSTAPRPPPQLPGSPAGNAIPTLPPKPGQPQSPLHQHARSASGSSFAAPGPSRSSFSMEPAPPPLPHQMGSQYGSPQPAYRPPAAMPPQGAPPNGYESARPPQPYSPSPQQQMPQRGWTMPPASRDVYGGPPPAPYSPHHAHASPRNSQHMQYQPPPLPGARPPGAESPYSPSSFSPAQAHPPAGPLSAPPSKPPVPRDLLSEEDEAPAPSASRAPGAPPPVLPPNPELLSLHHAVHQKLSARVSSIHASCAHQSQRMSALASDLDRGEAAIHDEIARLQAVKEVCRGRAERMAAFLDEAQRGLQSVEAKVEGELEKPGAGDDWIIATSIVGNQLIDLVAEDNAIEDTLYHLSRALNSERISLDAFLKQTRILAREQFMRRALAIQICKQVGWN